MLKIKDISYKNYRKKDDIHGTVLYPATMVAPVQNDVLKKIISTESIESIFDPFCGSGTALYEAMLLDQNLQLTGCDINPLAHLITTTKLMGIEEKSIARDIGSLEDNINKVRVAPHSFDNIKKWYRKDIITDLSKIRYLIMQTISKKNRNYFWCMFSDVLRRYSNTRSSTYKLHAKEEKDIAELQNNVIEDFLNTIKVNKSFFLHHNDNFQIYKSDILYKIKDFNKLAFDISITSPPYGDNPTTVTYGQFSSLALKWIDPKDLQLEGWELDNYSIIDRKSIGGNAKPIEINEYQSELLKPYLASISNSKKRKVELFFSDYFSFLDELCRVTKKYIVMTLGNRRVDNVLINLTDITTEYLGSNKFKLIKQLSRDIPNKRMPRKTSQVNNKSVASMNEEYVIIHKRF